jgi:hypothetical protein
MIPSLGPPLVGSVRVTGTVDGVNIGRAFVSAVFRRLRMPPFLPPPTCPQRGQVVQAAHISPFHGLIAFGICQWRSLL